jgi:hypothetical protein
MEMPVRLATLRDPATAYINRLWAADLNGMIVSREILQLF